jgi:N6-adenosine-specific RNA methylase IME4
MIEGAKEGGRGNKKPPANFAQGFPRTTRERLANCVGISHTSLRKAEEIVTAAEQEPEKYADLVNQMDLRYRSLDWVYRKLKVRREAERLKAETPAMPSGKYSVIVVDPPWTYESDNGNAKDRELLPYASMSEAEIMDLPIPKLADDDAVLFLWATNSHLHCAFHVLEKWGFQYRTLITWVKNARSLGSWCRTQTEHALLATKGKPFVHLTTQTTVIHAGVGRTHSRKPDEAYEMIEQMFPQPKKLDFFARRRRPGWHSYGLIDDENGNGSR